MDQGSSSGFVVGTSLNGIGKKIAFLLDLPPEDFDNFISILDPLTKSGWINMQGSFMRQDNLYKNYLQVIQAVELCLSNGLALPTLILIYSLIDSVSWLACNDDTQKIGVRFQSWVNEWMLKKYPLPCNAEELYSARCGILHTLTPESDLTKKGVKLIAYAWGKGKQEDLIKANMLVESTNCVSVHIDNIFSSFKNGFADFLKHLEENKDLEDLFIQKANKHFAPMDTSTIETFLQICGEQGISPQ